MAKYTTIEAFKNAHPAYIEAIQCVFVSEDGDIHSYFFTVEDWHTEMKNLMTSYVFVNLWKSIVHTIKVA